MILEVDIEMNQIRQSIGAEVRFKFFQFSFVYITFAIYVPANLQIFELQAYHIHILAKIRGIRTAGGFAQCCQFLSK